MYDDAFFSRQALAQLLGDEIYAEHLNDDCLDKIADYGVTKLYSEIAFEVAQEQGVLIGNFRQCIKPLFTLIIAH